MRWDVGSKQPPRTLQQDGVITWLAFSPDGSRLATARFPTRLEIRDPNDGRVLIGDWSQSQGVTDLAFSSDGRLLASATIDIRQPITLWDCEAGRRIGFLLGHSGGVNGIAFLPGDTELISSSGDGTLRLWDVRSLECTAILFGYEGGFESLALSPDGSTLATAGGIDVKILLWDMETVRRELERVR